MRLRPGEACALASDGAVVMDVLAAATLVELGLAGTGDVIGGFEGWQAAGLPVTPAPPRLSVGGLPRMGPADK
jgi:hypothetical protein